MVCRKENYIAIKIRVDPDLVQVLLGVLVKPKMKVRPSIYGEADDVAVVHRRLLCDVNLCHLCHHSGLSYRGTVSLLRASSKLCKTLTAYLTDIDTQLYCWVLSQLYAAIVWQGNGIGQCTAWVPTQDLKQF